MGGIPVGDQPRTQPPPEPPQQHTRSFPPEPFWEQQTPQPQPAWDQPTQPPPPPREWDRQKTSRTGALSSNAVKIGAAGAIGVLCIGGYLGYQSLFGSSDGASNSSASNGPSESAGSGGSPGAAGADVDQIKQLVKAWDNDLNNHDLSGLRSLMCSGSASKLPHDIFLTRDHAGGTLSSDVSDIKVTGNQATATVTNNWAGGSHSRFDNSYAKESGAWKICHTLSY